MQKRRDWGALTERILNAIEECGPMTRSELERHLNVKKEEFGGVIGKLVKPGKTIPQRAHICDYTHDEEGSRRYPRAVYAFGPGVNKMKPKADPKAVKARYNKTALGKVRNASVFNLALTREQIRSMKKNVQAAAVHMGQGS